MSGDGNGATGPRRPIMGKDGLRELTKEHFVKPFSSRRLSKNVGFAITLFIVNAMRENSKANSFGVAKSEGVHDPKTYLLLNNHERSCKKSQV